MSGADGAFSLKLPGGNYELAPAPGAADDPPWEPPKRSITVDRDLPGLDFERCAGPSDPAEATPSAGSKEVKRVEGALAHELTAGCPLKIRIELKAWESAPDYPDARFGADSRLATPHLLKWALDNGWHTIWPPRGCQPPVSKSKVAALGPPGNILLKGGITFGAGYVGENHRAFGEDHLSKSRTARYSGDALGAIGAELVWRTDQNRLGRDREGLRPFTYFGSVKRRIRYLSQNGKYRLVCDQVHEVDRVRNYVIRERGERLGRDSDDSITMGMKLTNPFDPNVGLVNVLPDLPSTFIPPELGPFINPFKLIPVLVKKGAAGPIGNLDTAAGFLNKYRKAWLYGTFDATLDARIRPAAGGFSGDVFLDLTMDSDAFPTYGVRVWVWNYSRHKWVIVKDMIKNPTLRYPRDHWDSNSRIYGPEIYTRAIKRYHGKPVNLSIGTPLIPDPGKGQPVRTSESIHILTHQWQ